MTHTFPRPTEQFLSVQREPVDGVCSACGAHALARYPVMTEGGWWNVTKCQECLTSITREKGPLFGSFVPLSFSVYGSEDGRRS